MKRYVRADVVDIWEEPYNKRMEVAQSLDTSPRVLMRLAEHEYDYSILGQVAINPNTPVEALKLLAESPFAGVRACVTKNPNTSPELLRDIYNKTRVTATAPLCAIGANPKTPSDILRKLAGHYDEVVRSYVAKNPSTPDDALDQLTHDSMFMVQEAATYNPKCKNPEEILNYLGTMTSYTSEQLRTLACNPKTPVDLLLKLSKDRDPWVVGSVVRNPNTPISLLKQLSNHKSGFVRHCLAKNARTPSNILAKLSNGLDVSNDDWGMADALIANPNTPISVIRKFAQSDSDMIRRAAEARLQQLGESNR